MAQPRVLIVEDSVLIGFHLKTLIENAGYSVCGVCSSGEDAIHVAEFCEPDLILMDITLAGKMDRVAAATIIKASMETQVVFLSALTTFKSITGSSDVALLRSHLMTKSY